MCLGIPMKIISIDGVSAQCQSQGVQRDVNLFMLQHEPLTAGDYVLVHVGYAIQKVAPQQARSAWSLFDQMTETATDA